MQQRSRPGEETLQAVEDGLSIRLTLAGGEVTAVGIGSRGALGAARVFAGKAPERVPELARSLFAVCGQAQGVAAKAALEAARGSVPDPATYRTREAVLLGELAREHLTRILLVWPPALGRAPAAAPVREARAVPQRAAEADDWAALAAELAALLRRWVLGAESEEFLALGEAGELRAWIRRAADNAPAPAYLRHLEEAGWAGLGGAAAPWLPDFAAEALEARLGGPDGEAFAARPDWQGGPRETGPLARAGSAPPVAAAREAFGPGVAARAVARLAELAAVPGRLRRLAAGQGNGWLHQETVGAGVGLGMVEAARGRLVHRLVLGEGEVADYRILAPTEWNFHPEGSLALGLTGERPGDEAAAREAAGYLVGAIDPCVGYRVEVVHA